MDHVLNYSPPTWVESVPPGPFVNMVGKCWYYKTDCFYLALLFTAKSNPDRCMAVYHLKNEPVARNEKYDTVQIAMESVQRILSENQAHIRVWGEPGKVLT